MIVDMNYVLLAVFGVLMVLYFLKRRSRFSSSDE
jgi:hypothetical protein